MTPGLKVIRARFPKRKIFGCAFGSDIGCQTKSTSCWEIFDPYVAPFDKPMMGQCATVSINPNRYEVGKQYIPSIASLEQHLETYSVHRNRVDVETLRFPAFLATDLPNRFRDFSGNAFNSTVLKNTILLLTRKYFDVEVSGCLYTGKFQNKSRKRKPSSTQLRACGTGAGGICDGLGSRMIIAHTLEVKYEYLNPKRDQEAHKIGDCPDKYTGMVEQQRTRNRLANWLLRSPRWKARNIV
ncbi:hypothetical protein B0H13DRAFT_1928890 [Mycena leptocephala]|nr:hypothetical protein B0H13DRAFT_1928890 [Mycena leptocephala]